MSNKKYSEDNITVLEGLEAVRKRPGMYIGSVGTKGINHLIYELMDNSVDEHLASYCSEIHISLEEDGSCIVADNGRGIPVGLHKKGVSATRVVLTTLHAGAKFDNESYKTSGGLHGVGSSVVNALSAKLEIKVYKDGFIHYDSYEKGTPKTRLEKGLLPIIGKTKKTGTEIKFIPDKEIFEKIVFNAEWLKSRMKETAYLNKDLKLYFYNKRKGEEESLIYHEPEGLLSYIKEINAEKEVLHSPIHIKGNVDDIDIELIIQFVNTFEENILGFCNNIFTKEGGTHIVSFKTKFTQLINSYAKDLGILKEKDSNFTGADTRNGMSAILVIKHKDPIFEGQTKTKLASVDVTKAINTFMSEELSRFFDRNVEVVKVIIESAIKSAKIRKAQEKTKTNMLTKAKFSFDGNSKLANAQSRDPKKCELFIVEGNSAGGSAKNARDRKYQAILPIRGKILNVEKASIDKVLANVEIKTLINTFGTGFSEGYGNDFDISKLKYHKIILLTDADVDGSHIDTLLLTFFYRFMPELIHQGYIYIAQPPLYKVVDKKGLSSYIYNDKELKEYKKSNKNFSLQRFKGLGEMDEKQLWETTFNYETRILKQVGIEDVILASQVTELLMGSNVEPRRNFIYKYAQDANLDV